MSFTFSRALVVACSQDISSDGDASAPSNSTPTPDQSWWPDKTTEHSRLSRFGTTFGPLTGVRGEELLTWWLEAFRVRTSALPGKGMDSTENAPASGASLRGSFAKYDPAELKWKTHQCSLVEGLDEFSETWPQWGSMRNGECWERTTAALPTAESASGSWPTPRSCSAMAATITPESVWNQKRFPNLETVVGRRMWPTPQASDNRDRGCLSTPAISRRLAAGKQVMLSMCVSEQSGRLNPRWVEWLMGWPIGWSSLQPLAMAKSQSVRQWHGHYSEMLRGIVGE